MTCIEPGCTNIITTPSRRKCPKHRKKKYTTQTLRPSRARPRALSVSKPYKRRTKRPKRQYSPGGTPPYLRTSVINPNVK